MNIPKFKDLIHKLSFLGNYSSLILPVIIAMVAALLFIPTQFMSSNLKKRIENESVSAGERVQSLSRSAVSRKQWEVEQAYQQIYERDANRAATLVKQSSQRPLLNYKIFPNPKDASVLIFKEFGRQFRSAIDGLITKVNATDCPTDAELQKGLRGSILSSNDGSYSEGTKIVSSSEVDTAIMDVLCREKAESARVYAAAADLSGYAFWDKYEYTGMDTAIEDCWYWQLAYWITEDVFDTIDAMNSGSNSVFASPVKRLLQVNFTIGDMSTDREGTLSAKPSYVLSINSALTEPHTGRFCNDDIDVVHFNITVVVSTKAVLPFMQQLCSAKQHKFKGFSGEKQDQFFKHNQITVLESNIRPIDREDAEHNLYRYGEDAVVGLNLVCEYIFEKSGYDEIKPELVKKKLVQTK